MQRLEVDEFAQRLLEHGAERHAGPQMIGGTRRVLCLERIEGAFDGLDEDEREVITPARVVGLSHKGIAEVMGRSEGATRVRLHRSLAQRAEVLDRRL